MKTIKSISGMVVIALFLAVTAFQSNSIAKTKPTGQTKHIDLHVSGMMCSNCSKSLESCLGKFKGAENVKANYNTGYASLDVPATSKVTKKQLMKAVEGAGFTLQEVKFTENPSKTTAPKQVSQ